MHEVCVPWSDLDVARLDVLDDVVVLPALLRDLRLVFTHHNDTSAITRPNRNHIANNEYDLNFVLSSSSS